jgi:DNA-binding transcriptional MerR regulator
MSMHDQSVFDQGAYSCLQAAQYLGISYATLRGWTAPNGLIAIPESGALSFNNLAEAHILKAMRRVHGLSLQGIRKALAELALTRKTSHPLLDESFETDGVDLCVREGLDVVNLSRKSQREFREFVSLYLHRIQRNEEGKVARLYPFVVSEREDEPKTISISPTVSFGKPVLAGTGISTSVIAGRFSARDSL